MRDSAALRRRRRAADQGGPVHGRLLDFFVLVRQMLETYNSSSPYVSIDDWEGSAATDCGCSMDADDAGSCDRCDEQCLQRVLDLLPGCDRYLCSDCTGECARVREHVLRCLPDHGPAGTRRLLCKSCLKPRSPN